jgi:hypothetical protein
VNRRLVFHLAYVEGLVSEIGKQAAGEFFVIPTVADQATAVECDILTFIPL